MAVRVLLVAMIVVLISPTSAAAQCPAPPPLKDALGEAQAAFVGVAERVSTDERTILVRVESIWYGDRLPEVVEVRRVGDPLPEPYEAGAQYLFITREAEGRIAEQDACTPAVPYTERVAALEPDGSIGPIDERTPEWIGILIALFVVGAWQASRARRRATDLAA